MFSKKLKKKKKAGKYNLKCNLLRYGEIICREEKKKRLVQQIYKVCENVRCLKHIVQLPQATEIKTKIKLTEHGKPAIMEKNKNHYIKK